ncbi:Cell division protein ZapA, inhibits GTPase activity of FtsZ [Acinetobacter marinus]|uniref:Cell division protein ZapA n=1 Tax=Acinetobacter marinus TaxID=281375 RepID=A0A1G6GNG5_9GAMM|nr:cell division protein ZapA [Acinetobacter marinus]SDB83541.1 Cell division protein ZapA, inhibits GTPase activity of FtsZ [Acinetobacter marinus]
MSENTAVEIWLLDSVYKLGCPADLQDDLRGAGDLLEQKFKAMRSANPRMDNQKVAVMVALQLMQDVVELNKSLQQYSQCENVLADVIEELDQQIEQIQTAKG